MRLSARGSIDRGPPPCSRVQRGDKVSETSTPTSTEPETEFEVEIEPATEPATEAAAEIGDQDAGEPPVVEQIEPGTIVTGTIANLTDFGAFVDIRTEDGTETGLVHISEVAPEFVENIYAHLTEGQQIDVKVLAIKDDGKIELSIKRTDPEWSPDEEMASRPSKSQIDKDFNKRLRRFMHKSQMIQGEARRQRRGRLGRDGS